MYTECMSEKENLSRMSIQLSEEEREFIIDLKYRLEKKRQTLKQFVMEALREKLARDDKKK